MFPKRLLALTLFAALAVMPACVLRAQWVRTSVTVSNNPVYCFAVRDSFLFVGTGDGIFRSTDTGTNWTKNNNGLQSPDYIHDLMFNGSTLYSASDGGGVAHSTDNGANWTGGSNGSSEVYAVTIVGTHLFAGQIGSGAGIDVSTDNGIVWNESWSPFDSGLSNGWVYDFAVSGSNIFAGTFDGGAFLSTDTGASWNAVDSGLTPENGGYVIYALLASNTNTSSPILFAGTSGGVFLSTNNGSNWTAVNNGFRPNTDVRSLTLVGTNLFAGTESGTVFLSTNNGTNWINVSAGLEGTAVNALAVVDSNLFAGTESDGIYRRPLSEMIGQSDVVEVPANKQEISIYPNPFSQFTQITFTSQTAGYAEVSIVNMLGVEVARLFSGKLGAGEHSYLWGNPTGLPDGVYECLVRMNGHIETLPMLLMKN
jgi:photosystem II stability/assembly factor-like uncharacterized protein